MAKGNVKVQGRRVIPALRRGGKKAAAAVEKKVLTLGDLIAAAYETVDGGAKDVAKVLGSKTMSKAIGKKLVFV